MSQNKKIILVIEDEEDTSLFIKDRLEMEGYQVVTAMNGQEGFDKTREHLPDLILLDVMMPKLNGYQVCRKLKLNPVTQAIPIVMVTAKAQESDIAFGKETGCDDYLTKPFEMDDLLEKIRKHLGSY